MSQPRLSCGCGRGCFTCFKSTYNKPVIIPTANCSVSNLAVPRQPLVAITMSIVITTDQYSEWCLRVNALWTSTIKENVILPQSAVICRAVGICSARVQKCPEHVYCLINVFKLHSWLSNHLKYYYYSSERKRIQQCLSLRNPISLRQLGHWCADLSLYKEAEWELQSLA